MIKEYTELKPLLKQIMRYVGNGYKYISISKIPDNKLYKRDRIITKLTKKYNLELTTWQRQYRKRKGIANYQALLFQNTIIVLKTEGKTDIQDNSFKSAINAKISFKYLSVILFVDERGKMTYKIDRELLRDIKAKLTLAIKNKNGRAFHSEFKKLYNLHRAMPYRGFMLQVKSILELTQEKQKKYGTKYQVPKFF